MKPDVGKMLDTMVEAGLDRGHVVWQIADDFDGTPRYALFEINRIDGEVVVSRG